MYSVIVFKVFWLVFSAVTIEGGQPRLRYMTEKRLMADPTKCRITENEHGIKIEDIAHTSNGTTVISVFGYRGQNIRDPIVLSVDNDYFKHTEIHVSYDSAHLYYIELTRLTVWNETKYYDNPLNMSKFVEIEIKLEMGSELRIHVSLPNGAVLFASHKTTINVEYPFELIHFDRMNNWFLNCPSSKMLSR